MKNDSARALEKLFDAIASDFVKESEFDRSKFLKEAKRIVTEARRVSRINAENVDTYRRRAGLHKKELTKQLGCSYTHLRNIMDGKSFPSEKLLNDLARILSVTPQHLTESFDRYAVIGGLLQLGFERYDDKMFRNGNVSVYVNDNLKIVIEQPPHGPAITFEISHALVTTHDTTF